MPEPYTFLNLTDFTLGALTGFLPSQAAHASPSIL